MEAVNSALKLNYNYNLEYANKGIQNYKKVSEMDTQQTAQLVKKPEEIKQQLMSDQAMKTANITTDSTDSLQVSQSVSSYTPVSSLSSQMMVSSAGYSSTGKLINEKQTLGFNIKI